MRTMTRANPACVHPKVKSVPRAPPLRALLTPSPLQCFLVEPYVSITVEKAESLRAFGDVMGFEVEAFHGHFGQLPLPKRTRQLCVATIERAEKVCPSLSTSEASAAGPPDGLACLRAMSCPAGSGQSQKRNSFVGLHSLTRARA